jgi:hypothetical protein
MSSGRIAHTTIHPIFSLPFGVISFGAAAAAAVGILTELVLLVSEEVSLLSGT